MLSQKRSKPDLSKKIVKEKVVVENFVTSEVKVIIWTVAKVIWITFGLGFVIVLVAFLAAAIIANPDLHPYLPIFLDWLKETVNEIVKIFS